MTREEALAQLRNGPGINEDVSEEYNEAVDMAIKALKQKPCEDTISRGAVLDLARKGVLVSNDNFESVCKAINDIPPSGQIE